MSDLERAREKERALLSLLESLESCGIAFSGGVDSTYLLDAAREALGERAAAFLAVSPLLPSEDLFRARRFCAKKGISLAEIPFDPFALTAFSSNPPDRCYHCKRAIFSAFLEQVQLKGLSCLAEGSNLDDQSDYRPGMRALRELSVKSPLLEAGLTKSEIRLLSKERGLKSHDLPSAACLASRICYGQPVTKELLARIDSAERFLKEEGFRGVRVRVHGDLARIELPGDQLPALFEGEKRERVSRALLGAGFSYVTADLLGYRRGSLNEGLSLSEQDGR